MPILARSTADVPDDSICKSSTLFVEALKDMNFGVIGTDLRFNSGLPFLLRFICNYMW